jgi:AcrR family transcriptional regulator
MGRPPKITDDEILAAARQVFLDKGAKASTLDIAERAGISEASIFKRFATKQALFMAAIGISRTPSWVKELPDKVPTSALKLELTEVCSEMLAFYQDVMPRVLMIMSLGELLRAQDFVPPPIRDAQLLAKFLERAVVLGHLRPCNAKIVAHTIVGAINNYVATKTLASKLPKASILEQYTSIDPSIFICNLIDTLWSGIAPEE